MTFGSKNSHLKEEQKSWEHSQQHYDEDNFLARTRMTWWQEQSKRPWQNWGEVFRANVGYNPTHGVGSHSFHPTLLRQFKGMRNKDPGEVQQKALPVCVYRELHRLAIFQKSDQSHLDESIAWILTLAYFWCMRSCEYSDVQGERRTKIFCVRNF
jgi:hypothetical protein